MKTCTRQYLEVRPVLVRTPGPLKKHEWTSRRVQSEERWVLLWKNANWQSPQCHLILTSPSFSKSPQALYVPQPDSWDRTQRTICQDYLSELWPELLTGQVSFCSPWHSENRTCSYRSTGCRAMKWKCRLVLSDNVRDKNEGKTHGRPLVGGWPCYWAPPFCGPTLQERNYLRLSWPISEYSEKGQGISNGCCFHTQKKSSIGLGPSSSQDSKNGETTNQSDVLILLYHWSP